jgi:hypothetical protein
LDENAVIEGLCAHLQREGYSIDQRLHTTQQGVDIIATHATGRRLLVEAKGATSSREGSARYGMGFTGSQVFDRMAKGVFTTLKLRAQYQDRQQTEVALAVPDLPGFRRQLEAVKRELSAAGLRVFLVAETSVSELA